MSNYSRDQVMNVISSVMGKVNAEQIQPLNVIHEELSSLAKTIDDMHAEILATQSHEVGGKHVPNATDELDAVIGATEEASATIMDSCEEIQKLAADCGEKGTAIVDQTNKIFEACSFQDITGQRITKVVKTLKDIEVSVDKLLGLFGTDTRNAPESQDNRSEDEKLMNGPQLEGQGVTQEEIDRMLAEFD